MAAGRRDYVFCTSRRRRNQILHLGLVLLASEHGGSWQVADGIGIGMGICFQEQARKA